MHFIPHMFAIHKILGTLHKLLQSLAAWPLQLPELATADAWAREVGNTQQPGELRVEGRDLRVAGWQPANRWCVPSDDC